MFFVKTVDIEYEKMANDCSIYLTFGNRKFQKRQ